MKSFFPPTVLLLAFSFFLSGAAPATAATLEVCQPPGLCGYDSIQSAIDEASDGDTVLVRDGTYRENIRFEGLEIVLRSVNGAEKTIIDGGGEGSVVTIDAGEGPATVLDGFTITNGAAVWGGGIMIEKSSPTIKNCRIGFNEATRKGGGVYCFEAFPVFISCIIGRNLVDTTYDSAAGGGGIYIDSWSEARIEDSMILHNRVNLHGSHSYSGGGGLYADDSLLLVKNSTIARNIVAHIEEGFPIFSGGGGVYLSQSAAKIEDTFISKNESPRYGGGITAIFTDQLSESLEVSRCTIENNAASSNGGGVWIGKVWDGDYDPLIDITANLIRGNQGVRGGGIYAADETVRLVNNTISGNAASSYGGGVYVSQGGVDVVNTTIASNSSSAGGGGFYMTEVPRKPSIILNSIAWGNTTNGLPDQIMLSYSASLAIAHSDLAGGAGGVVAGGGSTLSWGDGNVEALPLFLDPLTADQAPTAGGNYHLQTTSPLVGAGTNDTITYPSLPASDIDGDPRASNRGYTMGSDEIALPFPDVKVNGSDGPVVIGKDDPLTLTVTINPGIFSDMPVDYWVAMRSPSGPDPWYSYSVRESTWVPGKTVAYQGGCRPITSPFSIPALSNLPGGTYLFFFGVDSIKNGMLDKRDLFYDSVQVTIR